MIRNTFNAAVRHFQTTSQVRKIAVRERISPKAVVVRYCRARLSYEDADRLSELVLASLD